MPKHPAPSAPMPDFSDQFVFKDAPETEPPSRGLRANWRHAFEEAWRADLLAARIWGALGSGD